MPFDREIFFDKVRDPLFQGHLDQNQVDGMNAILDSWEKYVDTQDMRWLADMLAQTYHETSQQMEPIEEYGRGAGQPYGEPDPVTGQTYYGRGFVQLTWKENYQRADEELDADGNIVWIADLVLEYANAARIMYLGMTEGWFRSDPKGVQSLPRYFNDSADDPYGSREILNGDKNTIPSWSNGRTIGELIVEYYDIFLGALQASRIPSPDPVPPQICVNIAIDAPEGVQVSVKVNGQGL